MEYVPLSSIAEVNPSVSTNHLFDNLPVSFIPMSDVTEAGQWICHQERQFKDLSGQGYTLFQEGDILFAKITPCMENGKGAHAIGLINGIGFGTTEFHVLRVKFGNKARFLYHWLQSDSLRLKAEALMTGSAGQRRVTPKFFDIYYIPSLSPSEQQPIAHILDTLDTQIHQTETLIAKLKQIKLGLLHDLLTQGIDENGDVRDPVTHPEQFKDTEMGRIPKGWEVCPIEEKLYRIIDYRGKTPHKTNTGIPLITAKNVKEGFLDINHTEYIKESDYDKWMNRGIPSIGDVLFTTEAPLGNVAQIPDYKVALSQRILTLCVNSEVLDKNFLLWLLLWENTQELFRKKSTGSTVVGIKQSVFRKVKLQFPSLAEQKAINKVLYPHMIRLQSEEGLLCKLKQIKKGLMHDLLTGRMRVTPIIAEREQLSI